MEESPEAAIHEPLAYLRGEFVPYREARLPVWDLGIVQGATVTEALRTFRHVPFRLDEHLRRLAFSLEGVGIEPVESRGQLRHLIGHLTEFNATAIPAGADLAINVFVTAGESRVHSGGFAELPGRPSVCISTRPLNGGEAARQYEEGASLIVSRVRHIPATIIDPRIKYRSRLHWFLADQEAQLIEPRAEAVLLDQAGFVTETSRGNLFARYGDRVVTPSERTTLAGISQAVVMELCAARGLVVAREDLTPERLGEADEVWQSNTTMCLVPVTRWNQRPIANGRPGPMWRSLLADWSDLVGVDIIAQASSSS